MLGDSTQGSADGAGPEATHSVRSVQVARPVKRPRGRSFDDFRNQETESGLQPAEEKLLNAVAEGELCDLSNYSKSRKLREELENAASETDVIRLAAEVVASPKQIFLQHYGDTKEERDARINLEARVQAHPRILREFLTELPAFAEGHAKAPNDLKARVIGELELLLPILEELRNSFLSELRHWRQVDPADPGVRVRAAFVRFLALGGDEFVPVHEKGVRLEGAFIDGTFDLAACTEVRPLELKDCFFSDPVEFPGTRLRRLSLSGCRVPSIEGVRSRTDGSVFLDEGFLSSGSVRLVGTAIGGTFDCGGGKFRDGLTCFNGHIAGDVRLNSGFNANGAVSLSGAEIGGELDCSDGTFRNRTEDGLGNALSCSSTKIGRNFTLRSSVAEGEISLAAADIGGELDCSNGTFRNRTEDGSGDALNASNARIRGNMVLSGNFSAEGSVNLWGVEIDGVLACIGGTIRNRTNDGQGNALILQRAKVAQSVYLRDGFHAEGCVNLMGAHITGMLDCFSATFDNLVPATSVAIKGRRSGRHSAAIALDLTNVTIGDALWLAPSDSQPSQSASIKGTLDLQGAHARLLVDHPDCWPRRIAKGPDGKKLICSIALDAFTYGRLANVAPTDAERRLVWLSHQPPEHLLADFRPHSFEQLIKVLREMGHDADAQQIAVGKLRMRRRAKWAAVWNNLFRRPRRWWGWMFKPFAIVATLLAAVGLFLQWMILDLFLGSGYAKVRPVLLFLVMLLGCAWYYDRAAEQMAFVPTNPVHYNDAEVRRACAGTNETPDISAPIDWYRCKKAPPEFNPFRPLVYSVDQMIPFIQLGQKRDWQPTSREIRFDLWGVGQVTLPAAVTQIVTWSQIIGSMLLYLLIAAILGGLIKRD